VPIRISPCVRRFAVNQWTQLTLTRRGARRPLAGPLTAARLITARPKTIRHSDILMAISAEGGRVGRLPITRPAVEGTLNVSPNNPESFIK